MQKLIAVFFIGAVFFSCHREYKKYDMASDIFSILPNNWEKNKKYSSPQRIIFFNKDTYNSGYSENIAVTKIDSGQPVNQEMREYLRDLYANNPLFKIVDTALVKNESYEEAIADFIIKRKGVNLGSTVFFIKFKNGSDFIISHTGRNEPEESYVSQRQAFIKILNDNIN